MTNPKPITVQLTEIDLETGQPKRTLTCDVPQVPVLTVVALRALTTGALDRDVVTDLVGAGVAPHLAADVVTGALASLEFMNRQPEDAQDFESEDLVAFLVQVEIAEHIARGVVEGVEQFAGSAE